jgi:ABC-type glycerol-3-phosphate transport system substrate-binding protein
MLTGSVTRRKALKLGAAASVLPLVHIRTAGAAGKVSIALWNHWVEEANNVLRRQIAAFSATSKVEVQADFIDPTNSNQLILIEAAEALAKAGHDIYSFPTWEVQNHVNDLEPVDDLMGRLVAKFGPVNPLNQYLAKSQGHWLAIPSSTGGEIKGPEARISIMKEAAGLDLPVMFPANDGPAPGAETWTWDAHLKAAEACAKVGKNFGIGLGTSSDSVDFAGALFAAHGAELVNAKGDITVKSDAMREVMEYAQRLVKVLPNNAVAYDDTSNNRALLSGQSALIFNPPSPWVAAKRDAPAIGADMWHFTAPSGPKGRYVAYLPYFWGIWNFAQNKPAAKDLIEYLCQREQVEARCNASQGYDMPPFDSMLDFKVWETAEPPKGTLYNYPIRPQHKAIPHIAGLPAPPEIAVQIYNQGTMPTMMAKLLSGQSINDVIAWAQNELESFVR